MAQFSANQASFLRALVANSNIHPGVAAAWMAAEEPVGAKAGYHGTQDWLNVGITDSGPRGAGNPAWKNPSVAGKLTAKWLQGQWKDPGFGTASTGIQNITRARTPQQQIKAIQGSGWASSGYPNLGSLFSTYRGLGRQVANGVVRTPGTAVSRLPGTTQGPSAPKVITTHVPDYATAGAEAFLKAAGTPFKVGGGVINPTANFSTDYANALQALPQKGFTHLAPTATASQQVTAKAVHDAASGGANADAQKLLNMLHMANGAGYNQGNHDAVAEHHGQIKAQGTDCSGLVSWLMGPHGLGIWSSSQTTPTITSAPGMQRGPGHTVTVYDNPQAGNAGHVFIEIKTGNGAQYWASEGGVGVHQLPLSEVQGYIQNGSDGGHYVALHPQGL